jgi:hypothetical protein
VPNAIGAPNAAVAAINVAAVPAVPMVATAAVAASATELYEMEAKQAFRLNNVALKFFRDTNEDPPGFPLLTTIDLTAEGIVQIGVIEKNTGTAYKFVDGELQPWSWREMLAGMPTQGKNDILGGMDVVKITCEAVPGSYDHKRWHVSLHGGRRLRNSRVMPPSLCGISSSHELMAAGSDSTQITTRRRWRWPW